MPDAMMLARTNPGADMRLRHDPRLSECATLGEIAAGLGITDQAFYNLRRRYPDTFPAPLRKFQNADIYWRWEVEEFHREHGRGYGVRDQPIRGRKARVRSRA